MLALRSAVRRAPRSPALAAGYRTSAPQLNSGRSMQQEKEAAVKGEKSDGSSPGLSDHAESQAKGGKGKNPANPEDVQAEQSAIEARDHPHSELKKQSGNPTTTPRNL